MARKVAMFLGLGYVASHIAPLLQKQAFTIAGTTRDTQKAEELAQQGIESYVWPLSEQLPMPLLHALDQSTHWFITVPPNCTGDPVHQALENCCLKPTSLAHIIYFSATSVYGDQGGNWVDESTPPTPSSKKGRCRLEAENQWIAYAEKQNVPLTIFRLSGIYGPGRSMVDRVKTSNPIPILNHESYISRIHVKDIAKLVSAYLSKPQTSANEIYNIADTSPAPYNETLLFAYGLNSMTPPPAQPLSSSCFSDQFREFMADNKKVRAEKILAKTGEKLIYPTYKEGFQQ